MPDIRGPERERDGGNARAKPAQANLGEARLSREDGLEPP